MFEPKPIDKPKEPPKPPPPKIDLVPKTDLLDAQRQLRQAQEQAQQQLQQSRAETQGVQEQLEQAAATCRQWKAACDGKSKEIEWWQCATAIVSAAAAVLLFWGAFIGIQCNAVESNFAKYKQQVHEQQQKETQKSLRGILGP